ncbi:MAG TPA: AMP-binding protein [Acidimicrobiales bacterium]|nr:AMP-binding protein [Acidimicrobiales bacterium]
MDRVDALRTGMTVAYWAAEAPDRMAITSDVGTRTYGELNARANQVVRALRRRGVQAGDAVALMCGNRPEFAEAYSGCLRTGIRLTTINWHLTADEAAYIIDNCEAKAFIADARFAEAALGAAEQSPGATARLAIGGKIDGFDAWEDALAAEDDTDIDEPKLGSTMLYTSGTTGRPKGVLRRGTAPTATSVATAFTYDPTTDVALCTGPLYHAAPLAFSLSVPLINGLGVVLMDGWDAEDTLRLIERHRVTHSHMVPTMFHRLVTLPDDVRTKYDTSSLKAILHGAAPCPVAVKQSLMDWLGPIVWEYYAATEGWGSFVTPDEWLAKPGTVGKPSFEDGVRILDDDMKPLGVGEIGTLYLLAPQAGRFEYYGDPDKTTGAYLDTGDYFTLGDMGYFDEDGYLFLTDRSANLIISGGVNIYPAEVDAVLLQHPAVADAATIGIPNDEWGEEVKAVVELKRDVAPTPELAAELMAHCRAALAGYKCPRSVDFTDALPRHDTGKIYKRFLRDQYREAANK